jgi:hypothetical protein
VERKGCALLHDEERGFPSVSLATSAPSLFLACSLQSEHPGLLRPKLLWHHTVGWHTLGNAGPTHSFSLCQALHALRLFKCVPPGPMPLAFAWLGGSCQPTVYLGSTVSSLAAFPAAGEGRFMDSVTQKLFKALVSQQ